MTRTIKTLAVLIGSVFTVMACSKDQRAEIDSAAGTAESALRTTFSVIDVDMGKHIDADRKITEKTDDFMPTDTIYASVHTSGTANASPVTGHWMFQDGSTVDQKTENVTTSGDAYTAFYITKPGGLAKGKYTFHVMIDGKEVRSKDVTVK